MNASPTRTTPQWNPLLIGFFSLVVPGAGQVVLNKRNRGLAILVAMLVHGYLIFWALDNFQVGELTAGGVRASWLALILAMFWAWNVQDAYRLAQGRRTTDLIGLVLPGLVLYIIAWQVTDVRLDRLITRFGNALKIGNDLIHPDLFVQDASGAWTPSENFGYIFGMIQPMNAPDILVKLGLVQQGTQMPGFQAGKIIETIALGLMSTIFSTILAIPLSFFAARNITARIPGGTVVYYVMRTLLNFVRSIDTLIWGLIVVLWVGLGSFAGVIALTIHSVAALGKLFSEEVEHIDAGPIEAITATGANLLQTIRYGVIPQIVPPFLAYTLLRWDINMRSATIVGFVAGGGVLGIAALWAVAVVVMAVDYVSAKWRERIMLGTTHVTMEAPRPFWKSPRALAYILLGTAVFLYAWDLCGIDLKQLLDPAPTFWALVGGFVSLNLAPEVVDTVVRQMIVTIFQALLATTVGALVAVPFSFLAARNLTGRSRLSIWIYYLTRATFNLLRSIEALLYVAIFFYWVSFGNFAGMLALAVTTFGLIGKLFSEAIESIDPGPLEAISATGANRLQVIAYGVLPQIVPPFVSYAIYQWDINVRMATIVGFAGGGGIGWLLYNDYFPFMKYRSAGTAVLAIVIVVAIMDFASAKIRERMV
jgi:phosphonate transport system permease protein